MLQAIANMKTKNVAAVSSATISGTNTTLDTNTGMNVVGAVRIGTDRVLAVYCQAGITTGKLHCKVIDYNSGSPTLTANLALSSATSITNDASLHGVAADQDEGYALHIYPTRQLGDTHSDMRLARIEDNGGTTAPTEGGAATVTPSGFGNDVCGADVCFMGSDATYSYFAVALVYQQFGAYLLELLTYRVTKSTGTTTLRDTIILDTGLSTAEFDSASAPNGHIDIHIAARAFNDVIINLQGGNWHRATYNEGTNTWTDQGEAATLSGTAQGYMTGAKESLVNDFKPVVVCSPTAASGDADVDIEFIGTAVTGDTTQLNTNHFAQDHYCRNMPCRGFAPDGTTQVIAGAYRENTTNDLGFWIITMSGDDTLEGTEIITTDAENIADVSIAQLTNDVWVLVWRDQGDSGRPKYTLVDIT